MKNFWYLFAAYAIIWAALCVYTLWLGRREARLAAEVENLKALLSEDDTSGPDELAGRTSINK